MQYKYHHIDWLSVMSWMLLVKLAVDLVVEEEEHVVLMP